MNVAFFLSKIKISLPIIHTSNKDKNEEKMCGSAFLVDLIRQSSWDIH